MLHRILIIMLYVGFFLLLSVIGIRNKLNKVDSKGKSPINKYLFLLAKVTLLLPLMLSCLRAYKPELLPSFFYTNLAWIGVFILFIGFLIIAAGYISLGKYTKFGLPTDESQLITSGIYKYSRNPMYLGLLLMILGSVFYFPHWILIICAVLTSILHHKIILAEEKFLENAFGKEWKDYKATSKRYL